MASRRWFFSGFTRPEIYPLLDALDCRYLLYRHYGVQHLMHGVLILHTPVRRSFFVKFKGIQFEYFNWYRGPFIDLVNRIKSNKGVNPLLVERGEIPIPGSRRDLGFQSGLVEDNEVCPSRGFWFFGSPSSGATEAVLSFFPDCFRKTNDKWFDMYNREDVIFLNDFERFTHCGRYLKQWLDVYRVFGETKSKPYRVELHHRFFFITSSNHPKDYFDGVLLESILNRCRVYEFTKEGVNPPLPSDL